MSFILECYICVCSNMCFNFIITYTKILCVNQVSQTLGWDFILSIQFSLLNSLMVGLSTPVASHQTLFDNLNGDDHPMIHVAFIIPHVVGICTSQQKRNLCHPLFFTYHIVAFTLILLGVPYYKYFDTDAISKHCYQTSNLSLPLCILLSI